MVVLGLGLLTAPILARSLGPEDRGAYAAIIALLALAPVVFGLGMPMALRRRAALQSDVDDTYRTIYRALPFVIVVSAIIASALSASLLANRRDLEQWLFVICVVMACIFVLVLCIQSSLVVAHRYRGIALLQGTQGFITSVLIISVWISGNLSILTLELIYILSTAAAVAAALRLGAPSARGPAAPPLPLMRESAAYLGTQIADTATPSAPVILVFALLEARQAGYFSVAMTIASVPVAVAYAIGSVVFRAVATSEGSARLNVARHAVRSALISSFIVCGSLAAITPTGLPLLFGAEFRAAVPAALIMLGSAFFALVSYVCMQILAASGRPAVMTTWQAGGLFVSLVLIVVLGPHWQVTGAAFAVLAGAIVTAVGSVFAIGLRWSLLRISLSDIRGTVRLILRGDLSTTHS